MTKVEIELTLQWILSAVVDAEIVERNIFSISLPIEVFIEEGIENSDLCYGNVSGAKHGRRSCDTNGGWEGVWGDSMPTVY